MLTSISAASPTFDADLIKRLFRAEGFWGMLCSEAIRLNDPNDPTLVLPSSPDIRGVLDIPTATLQYERSLSPENALALQQLGSASARITFLQAMPLSPIATQQFTADMAQFRVHLADLKRQDNACHTLVSARVPDALWPTLEALPEYPDYLAAPEGNRAVKLFRLAQSALTQTSGAGLVHALSAFFAHKKSDSVDLPTFVQTQALLLQSSLRQIADPAHPSVIRLSAIASVAFLAALPPAYNHVVLELLTAHPTGQFADYNAVTSKVLLYDKSLQSLSGATFPPAAAHATPATIPPPPPPGSTSTRLSHTKPCHFCLAATGKMFTTHTASECRRGKTQKAGKPTGGAFAAFGSASDSAALAAWSRTADGIEFNQAMYQAQLDRALGK